jgi:cytochrome c oxidase subunit 2
LLHGFEFTIGEFSYPPLVRFIAESPAFPMFTPRSGYAHAISALTYGVLLVCLGILLIVGGLVTYSTWKFRGRPGEPEPKPIYGNPKLEIAYTGAFVLILSVVSYFSVKAMWKSDPPTRQADNLQIVAHQWWWEVRYPRTGLVTANEIHVMAGQPQRVGFRSADVIHDFWVPQLGRKMDVIPGVENHAWFAADQPGTYYGRCAEYCGQEHAWMRIRVIAQAPADYKRWEQAQMALPAASAAGPATAGAQDFQQLSCASCHTIRGTPAHARIGPDLTHVASRETIAAGRLNNTPGNLAQWLLAPNLVKPGCKMPNLHLTREQQTDLVAYLEGLR